MMSHWLNYAQSKIAVLSQGAKCNLIAFSLVFPLLLCGEPFSTELIAADQEVDEQPQTSMSLQGIFITENEEEIVFDGRPSITGIQITDIEIPGGEWCLSAILESYMGKPVTKETAIAIKQEIMTYYVDQGITMIGVSLPRQVPNGGVIQFLIRRKHCGQISYQGESLFDCEKLACYLDVMPCTDFDECELRNNLSWLNFNPFHSTTLKFVQNSDPAFVDLEFTSKRRRPLRFYVKGDNTGSFNTGYGRIYTGFAWGNAFNRGDILSFEYETSNEFRRLQTYTANYTCFLPWKNILTLFGQYGRVKPSSSPARLEGKEWQFRPRYTIPFKPLYTPLQQSVAIGFDIKNTNNSILNLSGSDAQIQPPSGFPSKKQIYVTQLVGSYTLYDTIFCYHSITINASFFASPFRFFPHQTDSDFSNNRYRSKPKYCYLNASIGDVFSRWENIIIAILLRGQIASTTLPSTELFSVGGYNTVRGYHEAEVSGDNGFIANLELRTRAFNIFPCCQGELLFLAFIDFGISNNWHVKPLFQQNTLPHTQYLVGVGPGLRYAINPYFQLRCDYGFKLHKLHSNTSWQRRLHRGFGELHVGAIASY